jgi:hypothetical protein
MPAKSSRYAPSNGVFPRNERMLFNDVTTRLKCKLQAQLQLAVKGDLDYTTFVYYIKNDKTPGESPRMLDLHRCNSSCKQVACDSFRQKLHTGIIVWMMLKVGLLLSK